MKYVVPALVAALLTLSVSAQNTCGTAISISPGEYTVAALGGTAPSPICSGATALAAAGAWYRFTAANDTMMQVSSHVAGYPDVDTRMHVYTGNCANLVCYAGDDDSGPGYSSICTFNVTEGTTYYIGWDSYWTPNGFTFTLVEYDEPDPPQGIVTFTNTILGGSGYVMGVVDMNNDGLDDAVTPGYTSVHMNYQNAGGGFTSTTIAHPAAPNTASWSFAVGDIDANGYNDMLYGGGSGASFMIANSTGTGFTLNNFPQYIFCQRTNFVDVNMDGHLDAFSCHDVDANVAFINNGSGALTFNQGMLGTTCGNYGSIWNDYDNDGRIDLFVAKCGCDPLDLLMHNNSTLSFANVAPALGLADGHQSWSSAWGDFDNDGFMDIFIGASSSGYHKLMHNNGDGTFSDVTAGSGMDTFGGQSIEWTAHDFDNNGWVDIMGGGAIHYNNGDMTFGHDATAPGNGPIGDLNNDGFLDVVGGNIARMNGGNDNNWIVIRLSGIQSNKAGIGARITVTSALGSQIRDVKSGDGFEYMSTINAHFGIGADAAITSITVEWPSGLVDVIEDPAINGTLTIVEGISTGITAEARTAFSVYPNPVYDVLTITGTGNWANSPVSILDVTGKLVLSTRSQVGKVNVSDLVPGIYQLMIASAVGVEQARFTKD